MSESTEKQSSNQETGYKIKAGLFLATAGGIGLLAGFAGAIGIVKKQDPESFDKGMVSKLSNAERQQRKLNESGAKLATRALGHATIYAVGGCGLLFYSIWKLSGATDLADFRQKAGNILPKVPKNDPPQSRTEFSGTNDLLQYLIDKDEEEKRKKKGS